MLGKHHVMLTLYTLLPFSVPLFFLNDKTAFIYFFVFIVVATIGSLIPDADCAGKPTLYYRYQTVYYLMIPIIKLVILFFKKFKNIEYEVKEEHRGIMHSPIGILISSFLITLVVLIFLLIFNKINILFLLIIFFGLNVGQFFHLLEDTCTISGIKWGFPFSRQELRGNIYTNWKEKSKIDIRPGRYTNTLFIVFIILFLGYTFLHAYKKTLPLWIVYIILFILLLIIWLSFLNNSGVFSRDKTVPLKYLVDKARIKEQKKRNRQLFKFFSRFSKQTTPSFGPKWNMPKVSIPNYKIIKFQEPKINLSYFEFKKRRKRFRGFRF